MSASLEYDYIYWELDENDDLMPRDPPLALNYPVESSVEEGVVYGAEDQFTGTMEAPSPPTTPVLVITDKGDGTGALASLTTVEEDTTNVVYIMHQIGTPFTAYSGTWSVGNTMDLDLDVGVYWAYVASTQPGGTSVSVIVRFYVTSSGAANDNVSTAIKAMRQYAVYWPPETNWDEFGRPVPATPSEIKCRWEWKSEEYLALDGTKQISKARIIVDRDLTIGGVLWLGTLDGIDPTVDPKQMTGAYEIRMWNKTPNLKGSKFLRQVVL